MAVLRDRPYAPFNFLVDLGDGQTDGPQAGFQEVLGLATEVAVLEYRNGNSKSNAPIKLTGLARAGDVTLRRGLMGSTALATWLEQVRNGEAGALRTVSIHLMSEDRAQVVQSWKLVAARIVRHVSGPLHARGTEVAVEEAVLACERIETE